MLSSIGPFGHFYIFPFVFSILTRSHATTRPLHAHTHSSYTHTHKQNSSFGHSLNRYSLCRPTNVIPKAGHFFALLALYRKEEERRECVLCEHDLCDSARARRTASCVRRTAKWSKQFANRHPHSHAWQVATQQPLPKQSNPNPIAGRLTLICSAWRGVRAPSTCSGVLCVLWRICRAWCCC